MPFAPSGPWFFPPEYHTCLLLPSPGTFGLYPCPDTPTCLLLPFHLSHLIPTTHHSTILNYLQWEVREIHHPQDLTLTTSQMPSVIFHIQGSAKQIPPSQGLPSLIDPLPLSAPSPRRGSGLMEHVHIQDTLYCILFLIDLTVCLYK